MAKTVHFRSVYLKCDFEERCYHMGWILIECLMIDTNVCGHIVGTPNSTYIFGYWIGLKIICLILLASANGDHCHLKLQDQNCAAKIIGGQSEDSLYFLGVRIGPPNCVKIIAGHKMVVPIFLLST